MKRTEAWGITCKKGTPRWVGDIFEDLTRRVLGQSFEIHHDVGGDLIDWKNQIGVEVKASDNNHNPRVPLHQLDEYLAEVSLPLFVGTVVYAIWTYRNGKVVSSDRRKHTALSRHTREDRIRRFLTEHADTLYLFDVSVIQAMRIRWLKPMYTLPSDITTPVIELGRSRVLGEFRNGHTSHVIGDLGLQPYRYEFQNKEVEVSLQDFFQPTLKVRLVSVLKADTHGILLPNGQNNNLVVADK